MVSKPEIPINRCRCPWAVGDEYISYHDKEWGVPVHDDRLLFEFLILEGAQAGLSWITILKKREAYRIAFDQFDPEIVAKYGKRKLASLLANAGIVRNRLKIGAAMRSFIVRSLEARSFPQPLGERAGGVAYMRCSWSCEPSV